MFSAIRTSVLAAVATGPILISAGGAKAYPIMKRILALVIFAYAGPACADVIRYAVTDLGTLPGGNASYANGINNSGSVVGASYIQTGNSNVPHPVLYGNGTVQDLGSLGGDGGSASAINNAGQIVGTSTLSGDSAHHAFLYSNGTMTDLGTLPGEGGSEAFGINNAGQVVGSVVGSAENSGLSRAFLYSHGTMADIGTLPGKNYAEALGINDPGKVVGWSYNFVSSGDLGGAFGHAFLYSNGTMTDLGTLPGLNDSVAVAISNAGEITGYSWQQEFGGSQDYESFLYQDGIMTNLGALPNAIDTLANGINDEGQIVGQSYDGSWSAFLDENGQLFNLNNLIAPDSGWSLEFANGINDRGLIVGEGSYDGQLTAFMLTPCGNCSLPEPPSVALIGTAFAVLGFVRRRRCKANGKRIHANY